MFPSTSFLGVMVVRKEELTRVMLGKREKKSSKEAASMVTKVVFLVLLATFIMVTYLGNYRRPGGNFRRKVLRDERSREKNL